MISPRETAAALDGDLAALPLPSPPVEARAFWTMRARMVGSVVRQTLANARLRVSLIVVLSVLLWSALFWLFADGFRFLDDGVPDRETHARIVHFVFAMFFVSLMVMLVFSSGIILYGSLFRARDIPLLLTMPAREERIFLHKFQEAIVLGSWGFLYLGSPVLLAYGIVAGAPWYYYLMLLPYLLAFTYIPAAIGAIVCLALVRWAPGGRAYFLIGAMLLVLGGIVWVGWTLVYTPVGDLLTPTWLQDIFHRLRFSEQALLPSWWLSAGLLEAAGREWNEAVMFLALTIANAMFFRQLAAYLASRIYRHAYSRLHGHVPGGVRLGIRWLDRILLGADHVLVGITTALKAVIGAIDRAILAIPLLSRQVRLLIVKDLRLFRRDPVQWSQFLIFFALLALYFFNIPRFSYDVHHIGWVNMVSLLNLSVVGLLLSTFTTRFIFPTISLEGRRFWVLGLLPVRRSRILWGKFLFASCGSLVPCCLLILLSDTMLRVSPTLVAGHQLTCVILSLGLSGIAVGLGAAMPNLNEESPSRIAAGFGGTLNLVVSATYIVAVVGLTALPYHFPAAANSSGTASLLADHPRLHWWLQLWLSAGTAGSVLLGIVATVVPLAIGFRAFRRLEF